MSKELMMNGCRTAVEILPDFYREDWNGWPELWLNKEPKMRAPNNIFFNTASQTLFEPFAIKLLLCFFKRKNIHEEF